MQQVRFKKCPRDSEGKAHRWQMADLHKRRRGTRGQGRWTAAAAAAAMGRGWERERGGVVGDSHRASLSSGVSEGTSCCCCRCCCCCCSQTCPHFRSLSIWFPPGACIPLLFSSLLYSFVVCQDQVNHSFLFFFKVVKTFFLFCFVLFTRLVLVSSTPLHATTATTAAVASLVN